MTSTIRLLGALPLIALLTACVGTANNTVNTQGELESALDTSIDGDGTVPGPGGTAVQP
ncbi:MAG: hypothetical protein WBA25_03370 [Jannaschia sp.]